ncbi:MAG: PEP-CTERM sorting domain-containing protein [Planctomycetota bacterium]|nr:MAG: PEP-CTERM sorting domain-containing protein [Planctomycetota bacterium]
MIIALRIFLVLLVIGMVAHSSFGTPFVYDWSTAAAPFNLDNDTVPLDNNDGWINFAGLGNGSDDFVLNTLPPPLFSGNYFSGGTSGPPGSFGDDLYYRPNDGSFSFAIPANAATVSMSMLLRANNGNGTIRVGIIQGNPSAGGASALNFGLFGINAWGLRDELGVYTSSGTGAAALTDTTLRTYRATATLDMTNAGTATPTSLVVENLTSGGSEVIFSNQPIKLTASGAVPDRTDPSLWGAMYMRVNGAPVDDLTISFTVVPEPSAFALGLIALGVLGYFTRRRR